MKTGFIFITPDGKYVTSHDIQRHGGNVKQKLSVTDKLDEATIFATAVLKNHIDSKTEATNSFEFGLDHHIPVCAYEERIIRLTKGKDQ